MASHEHEISHYYSDTSTDHEDDNEQELPEENSRDHYTMRPHRRCGSLWFRRKILGPTASWTERWNRASMLVWAAGLFVDPLFFYTLAIDEACMCLFVDGWFCISLTVIRSITDALYVLDTWLQFKTNNHLQRPDGGADVRSLPSDTNTATMGPPRYLKIKRGFFFDLFVILPLPQFALWMAIPALLTKGHTTEVMTLLLILFLFQYLPKMYHSVCLVRRMKNMGQYIFGDVWWGIALNLIAYFVAAHAVGACWYLLGLQRSTECLMEQCMKAQACVPKTLSCEKPFFFGTAHPVRDRMRLLWGENHEARSICLESDDKYEFAAYKWVTQLVSNNSRLEKMLFPLFWGLMMLSTYGNLVATTDWLEMLFIIIILASGLLLVTMLIGNIKVFFHANTSKKHSMKLKMGNVEWWMKRRNLPRGFRQRVRDYERQRWAAMRGVNESDMIRNFPEGLRRDIKYHLCLELVRQVPLFHHMDTLVLENICDRVKTLIFTKGEIITQEGDPVKRMLFIVRGHLRSFHVLRDGLKSCCMLGPGNFTGDELLSWCLRRPFVEKLPTSSSTLLTLETTEAFALEAEDVKYVTRHFRYTFMNEKVKRSARYYSPGWRTWAAVAIQLAWRRYRRRLTLTSLSFIRPRRPLSRSQSAGEERLRMYAALLSSPKPDQDGFDF